jgi:hypothetical protein
MSITIRPDGSIVTEDVELALLLAQRLSRGAGQLPSRASTAATMGWTGFIGLLNERQRRLLNEIRAAGELTLEELRERLGHDKLQTVTGLLVTITRAVRTAQIPRDEVFRREERPMKGAITGVYVCGPMLKGSEPLA